MNRVDTTTTVQQAVAERSRLQGCHHMIRLLEGVEGFCVSAGWSRDRGLGCVNAVAEVLEEDVRVWRRSATDSFDHFKHEVLRISVERPPRSTGLLQPSQAVELVDFMLLHYYRRFQLYKYLCSPVPVLSLTQRFTGDVPPPAPLPPLSDAIAVGITWQPASSAPNSTVMVSPSAAATVAGGGAARR